MAETLGSLCDKLTVVKLKQWHAEEQDKIQSLKVQEKQLQDEINEFIIMAASGQISVDRLTFASNKIYNKTGNIITAISGSMGDVFSKLAEVNCALWHEQEKVYEFEKVPIENKDKVIKKLALLNLERTQCIDKIDREFRSLIEQTNHRT